MLTDFVLSQILAGIALLFDISGFQCQKRTLRLFLLASACIFIGYYRVYLLKPTDNAL